MGFRHWVGRVLGRRQRGGWTWEFQPIQTPGAAADAPKPRVTYPDEREAGAGAKVVLGFQDGTEFLIPDSDPVVKEFVRAADRMMRPARWKRLIKGRRTSV